mmetsp:Transcript_28468/g.45751  ORF Transcript_28468/g.45751 Transcript_28468/m.45751 type:complete len:198 (-) Transcript_28468:6-599(-)
MPEDKANGPTYNAAKWDASIREFLNKEQKLVAAQKKYVTAADRAQAIAGLNCQLRPRSAGIKQCLSDSSLPMSATITRLGLGDSVQLAGLRSRSELNGKLGTVVLDVPDAGGRICVKLSPIKGQESDRVMRVKKSNLRSESWLGQDGGTTLPSLGARLLPINSERRGFRRSIGGRFNSSALADEYRVGEWEGRYYQR